MVLHAPSYELPASLEIPVGQGLDVFADAYGGPDPVHVDRVEAGVYPDVMGYALAVAAGEIRRDLLHLGEQVEVRGQGG